jgi:phage/plasmid-associated DNA primase
MDFIPPPQVCPPNVYNKWRPFKIFEVEYDPNDNEYNKSIINRFIEFSNNLLGEIPAQYVIARFAQRLQKPAVRTEVSVLLFSEEEGTGKNTFFNIMKYIFGSDYYQEIGDAKLILKDLPYHT